jgi:hypothetical protein
MPTLEELQAELTKVNAAYEAALGGSEYEIESGDSRRKLKRQSLTALVNRKAELERSIARLSGNGVSHGVGTW